MADKQEETKNTEKKEEKAPSAPKAVESKKIAQDKPEEKKAVEGKKVTVSSKAAKIIEEIGSLSVLELNDLVKALEEKFEVKASAMVAAPAAAGATPVAGTPAEEKTEFTVVLTDAGANKISAIKTVRELKPDLGLKEAKDLVESAPQKLLEGVKKEEAEAAKKKLEAAGAQVELK